MRLTSKNKQTKRNNKNRKNNKSKRTKRILKGGDPCRFDIVLQEITTITPKISFDINLDSAEGYESFIDKINAGIQKLGYKLYLIKLYDNKHKVDIDATNFRNYCNNEIKAITMYNFIDENGIKMTEFINDIMRDQKVCENVSYLSALKPVATFSSSTSTGLLGGESVINVFKYYWNKSTDENKKQIIKHFKLCNRFKGGKALQKPIPNVDINVNENGVVFYSPEHFNYLCGLFGYTQQEGLHKINDVSGNKSPKDWLFIWIAFGDLIHPEIIKSTSVNETYEEIKKTEIDINGENKTCEEVLAQYKRDFNIV